MMDGLNKLLNAIAGKEDKPIQKCEWCGRDCHMTEYKNMVVPACDKDCAEAAFKIWPKIEEILTTRRGLKIFDQEIHEILSNREEKLAEYQKEHPLPKKIELNFL